MPLYNGLPLELHNYTKRLTDDEEVFHCELTNEIFVDYEEYCDRVLSCGSMVWSCAITGKPGLTYQEALLSEQNALKNIKDFSPELRTPVLYLASLTKRKHFSELADDVYNFVKDRFFVNESVQACFDEGVWSYGQVISVVLPKAEEVMKYCDEHDIEHPIHHRPYPASLYSYELEELVDDEDDGDCKIIKTIILGGDKIRRTKSIYSKDKNRAYLKQFTEQKKNECWKVKEAIMAKYAINTLRFADIFAGEIPIFDVTPQAVVPKVIIKSTKVTPKNGSLQQQSMRKFLVAKSASEDTTPNKSSPNKKSPKSTPKKSLSVEVATKIQKKYVATIERVLNYAKKEEEMRHRMEALRKKREEKRNEKEKLATFAREWQRKREDLECEDLIDLPNACPVDCRIPNKLFGDFMMALEFFTCFKDIINVKNYFPHGLTFDLLERALIDVEVAGPFSDILQLLLTALFKLQIDEDDKLRNREASSVINLSESADLTTTEVVKLATQAARWSQTYHNVPLNKLHMDAITVTDILRLHLLSSGGRAGEVSAKWRIHERGGYCSTDDPGLEFRIKEPQILKFLAVNSVGTLLPSDKIKIINCLMSQIVTYAMVRDEMDDRSEKVIAGRRELKNFQNAFAKEKKERVKEKKELNANEKTHLNDESEKKKMEYSKRLEELKEATMTFQLVPLGQDRGHRRYWVFSAISGLFVEDDERWPGQCLPQPTMINKTAVAVHDDDTMTYIRNLFEVGRNSTGSDKENEGDTNQSVGTPKKKHLAEMNGLSVASSDHKALKGNENSGVVCTAQEDTCTVHNPEIERTKWHFYYREDEVNELIRTLNKRGYREHALRQTLISEKNRVLKHMHACPVRKLNQFVPTIQEITPNVNTRSMKGYDDTNLGYPQGTPVETVLERYVRGAILDTEEKIFAGGLGIMKVNDRMAWRAAIDAQSYDSQDAQLAWPTKMVKDKEFEEKDDIVAGRPMSPCSIHSNSDTDTCEPEQNSTVRDLAMAVLQIARCIEPRYLQKPLPFEEKRPVKLTAMERWEFSLMRSTSFTQVYLHLSSLDNSVQWNKSALNARCKICRRKKDDACMLLCDGCDRGFHLYCLKPKLKSIPRGDWFCPNCTPQEVQTSTRSRRRVYIEEEEEENDESSLENVPLATRKGKRARDEPLDDHRSKRHKNS